MLIQFYPRIVDIFRGLQILSLQISLIQAAKEFIANECGGSRTNLDFVVADLSVLSEVRKDAMSHLIDFHDASSFQVVELANEVERRFPSLNVLLCNAGVLNQRRLETKDRLEMMFQVFYHFVKYNWMGSAHYLFIRG